MTDNRKVLVLKVDGEEIKILQRKDMFCISLDTILLTNFIKLKNKVNTVIDFGTNNGAIALFLALKYQVKVVGIEIQKEAVDLANENIILNNLQNKVTIINQDIKKFHVDHDKKVDVIVCNPPFFNTISSAKLKLQPLKVAACHETYIDLNNIITSAARLLKFKGTFFIIHHAQRLNELLLLLKANNFSIKRMQLVYPKINKQANAILVEAIYHNNTQLIIEPPLICHNQDNSYNQEIAKWYNKNNLE